MALSKAALKDLERQLETIGITEEHQPTLEDKKEFIAAQLQGSQKQVYRILTDVEVARTFASHKDDAYQEIAKQRFEESIASLKALKPTIDVLTNIAKDLEA